MVYGNQIGESGTPHLQSFVIFDSTPTLVKLKKIHPNNHWEITRKSSESASNYCKKGEQPKSEWEEHHDDGPNFGLNFVGFEKGDFPSKQGKHTDLHEMMEAIEDGMINLRDLRKHHPNAFSGHRRFAIEYVIDHKPPVEIPVHPLRDWQQQPITLLDGPVDDRKITFVIDQLRPCKQKNV